MSGQRPAARDQITFGSLLEHLHVYVYVLEGTAGLDSARQCGVHSRNVIGVDRVTGGPELELRERSGELLQHSPVHEFIAHHLDSG